MTNPYELTRKLAARGCPEHPRLRYAKHKDRGGNYTGERSWAIVGEPWVTIIHEDDACDLWTMWALEWVKAMPHKTRGEHLRRVRVVGALRGILCPDLEAIEAATRHLEPKS